MLPDERHLLADSPAPHIARHFLNASDRFMAQCSGTKRIPKPRPSFPRWNVRGTHPAMTDPNANGTGLHFRHRELADLETARRHQHGGSVVITRSVRSSRAMTLR